MTCKAVQPCPCPCPPIPTCRSVLRTASQTRNTIAEALKPKHLVEGAGPGGREDLLGVLGGRGAVRQRELKVLGKELLDVRAADVVGLGNLNDLEDLEALVLVFVS